MFLSFLLRTDPFYFSRLLTLVSVFGRLTQAFKRLG